ncbi:MAG TPA: tRNA1(Val) (adenine(37)-N6)-methyltransferase [Desulfuromonadales bacterium]
MQKVVLCPDLTGKFLLPNETLDDLRPAGLKVIQAKRGYRFSLDPVLLCAFALVGRGEMVADLGTGSGVVPLLLAARTGAKKIVGVEIQPELADRARRSVLLNCLHERIDILEGDLRDLQEILEPQVFDIVVANPPYRPPGAGRQAPVNERAVARHELAGGMADFLRAASYLLKNGGRFYIVFLAERLAELLAGMRELRLEPKRLRCVHSRAGERGSLVLVEGRKGGRSGLAIEPPLYVYAGEGYSAETLAIYEGGK